METLFWISTFTILYSFAGYGILITLLNKWKKKKSTNTAFSEEDWPEVTLLIAAYNEAEIIRQKIANCEKIDYPKDRLKVLFVTDGSTDQTNDIIKQYNSVSFSFSPERKGKIAAVNRIMRYITSPITVFSDANVMMNPGAIKALVQPFESNLMGAVSGEKIVLSETEDNASASGEGFYWKYESFLKKQDAEWNTLVGSAGELFAIRTRLFVPTEENTLIEDFVMTMRIAADGYKVGYEPSAMATETASANIAEETKRKVRISAGGMQAVIKLVKLLNVFKYGKLTFQYVSHRALRWTLMPLALIGAFASTLWLADTHWFYNLAFRAQSIFYLLAFFGYVIRDQKTSYKLLHIPYYFVYMHICVVKGWIKYFKGNQKVTWDKSERVVLKSSENQLSVVRN